MKGILLEDDAWNTFVHKLSTEDIDIINNRLKCDCCGVTIGYIGLDGNTIALVICEQCKNRRL